VRVRAALGGILGSLTVLVIGWQAGAAAAHNSEASASTSSTTGSSSSGSATSGSASTSTPTSTSAPSSNSSSSSSSSNPSSAKSGSFVGATANTQFGPVQVKIVVSNGKITNVVALQLTNVGGRSQQISNYAAPILRREVLAAQSAKVQSVGGATYTSEGYLSSLQSAIDKAGL
jgi:uncharacterized protein with FMN-binding domain